MVKYSKDRKSKGEILETFEPIVRKWFNERFNDLTPPQAIAVPLIKIKKMSLFQALLAQEKLYCFF